MWTRFFFFLLFCFEAPTHRFEFACQSAKCPGSWVTGIRFGVGYLLRRIKQNADGVYVRNKQRQSLFWWWAEKDALIETRLGKMHQFCTPQFLSRRFSPLPTCVEPLAADRKSWMMFSRPVIESHTTLRSPPKDEGCWVSGRRDTTCSQIHCGVDLNKLNELPAASRELAGCRVAWARPLQQWEGYLRGRVLKELHIASRAFKGVWQFCAHWQLGDDMKMCVCGCRTARLLPPLLLWPGSRRQWRAASTERLACWEVKRKKQKTEEERGVLLWCKWTQHCA